MDIKLIKKLKKFFPKSSLEICNYIMVQYNKAHISNLNDYIILETDWKDGFYDKSKIDRGKLSKVKTRFKPDDFVATPVLKNKSFSCEVEDIEPKIINFCSTDEAGRALTGIYLDKKQQSVVATNGHIFHSHNLNIKKEGIIRKQFFQIAKLLDCKKIYISDKYSTAWSTNGVIISRLIDGPYPNYLSVIPKNNKPTIQISEIKDKLINAINLLKPFVNKPSNMIKWDGNFLKAYDYDSDNKQGAKVDIRCDIFPFLMGFNYKYMLYFLEVACGRIAILERNTCGVVVKCKTTLTLIMPLRIKDDDDDIKFNKIKMKGV